MKTNTFKTIAILLLACCQTLRAETPLPPQTIRGFELPGAVAGFNRVSVVDYEKDEPGLGTAIHYVYPGVKGSVFIYNRGYAHLQGESDSPPVIRELKGAKSDLEKQYPGAQIVVAEQRLTVNGVSLLHAAYKYTDEQPGRHEPVFSHIYVAILRDHFIKLRVTQSTLEHPELNYTPPVGTRLATRFVEQILQALTK